MTAAHEWLARDLSLLWPSFADHLWQATLFALIVFAACFVLQRGPARLRHSFWLLASAKFLVPSALLVFLARQADVDLLWPFSWQQTGPGTLLIDGITQPVTTIANTFELTVVASDSVRHNELYCALTAVWLTGCLLLLVVWGMRRRRFLQALKRGRSVNTGREWQAFKRAKESLGLKTQVRLIISPQKTEPAVCRVWKPVVMLPESIAEHLDDEELEAIMLHELVHIKRHDNLIGNLQIALCALLWFHPLIWLISRKLFDEREQACDEKVLEIYCAPEAYASSILKVVRFCFGWNVAGVTGAGSGSNLRRRIDNIMSTNSKKRSASWTRL
ncbi:MAG: M56 family metallopeptidase, partial [Pyrinomonadaceae bacterium]